MADAFQRPQLNVEHQAEAIRIEARSRRDQAPPYSGRFGTKTVICMVLNRTIGSGIFVAPALVLGGTGSVGASLILWTAGGLFVTCGVMVWLELGLSLPLQQVKLEEEPESARRLRAVPRSGGEKNYLEAIYSKNTTVDSRPHRTRLVTCMYGIPFILLGNLAGNAVALGIYFMHMIGNDNPPKGAVLGIAIGALTLPILLHMFSRRAGIVVNNVFAVTKVCILLAIFVIGMMYRAGWRFAGEQSDFPAANFKYPESFQPPPPDVASVATSLLYIMYTYSGFEQPFYILTQVKQPRQTFPKALVWSMGITIALWLMVVSAYFCAVPSNSPAIREQRNMAIVFFAQVFGHSAAAKQIMSAMIVFSIMGNILIMTFTASVVKQELFKEGIMPWTLPWPLRRLGSAFFTATPRTLLGVLIDRSRRRSQAGDTAQALQGGNNPIADHSEFAPIPALSLHWFFSVLLIAITSGLEPTQAYAILVGLNGYVIVILSGFVTSAGLLYLHFFRRDEGDLWSRPNYSALVLGQPVYAMIYFLATGFVLFAGFGHLSDASPWSIATVGYNFRIIPIVGLLTPLLGLLWFYVGIRAPMKYLVGRYMFVERRIHPEQVRPREGETDPLLRDQWVTLGETFEHDWRTPRGEARHADDPEWHALGQVNKDDSDRDTRA